MRSKTQLDRLDHSTFLGLSHVPGIELAEKLVEHRAGGFAPGILFRQRRHRGRDRAQDGGAILAAQRRSRAVRRSPRWRSLTTATRSAR